MVKKQKSKKNLLLVLIILVILVFGLIGIFSFKTFKEYKNWNSHKDYFKQDNSNQKIEDWMTIRQIEKKFDPDIHKYLNTTISLLEQKKTLKIFCIERNFNCTKLIKELNEK